MVEIRNLSKAYGEKQVLQGFSCQLPRAGFTVLTGPSGVGKTTLLHILLGLVEPDAGEYPRDLRCSAVFQENRLLPGRSPVKNLAVCAPKGMGKEEITALLQEILPSDCLMSPVEALSGGMQRRVAIARAMAAPSDLILMDEPFTGLDPGTADNVMEFILRHQAERTLLIATHQRELVEKYEPNWIEL